MKNTVSEFFTQIGIEISLLAAGIAGAILYVTKQKKVSFKQALFTILSGGLAAAYLTPLAEYMLESNTNITVDEKISHALAFVIGVMAMQIAPFISEVLTEWKNKLTLKKRQNE